MVLFDVSGESMSPMMLHGDTVLIDQSQRDIIPGNIYGIGMDEEIVVKRVEKAPGALLLISENREKYPPFSVVMNDHSNVRIIGRVLWLGRRL
jgi:phage repressor protein C with HTH and peptisase S24 domain